MRGRKMMLGISLAIAALPLTRASAAPPEPVDLRIVLTGLRSEKGIVLLCLFSRPAGFPDCAKAEGVRRLEAPAAHEVQLTAAALPPGTYAVSAIHDENGNRKLDKSIIGMPTEGVGFSRNPRLMFGPPKFEKAQFELGAERVQTIRMKYFL